MLPCFAGNNCRQGRTAISFLRALSSRGRSAATGTPPGPPCCRGLRCMRGLVACSRSSKNSCNTLGQLSPHLAARCELRCKPLSAMQYTDSMPVTAMYRFTHRLHGAMGAPLRWDPSHCTAVVLHAGSAGLPRAVSPAHVHRAQKCALRTCMQRLIIIDRASDQTQLSAGDAAKAQRQGSIESKAAISRKAITLVLRRSPRRLSQGPGDQKNSS